MWLVLWLSVTHAGPLERAEKLFQRAEQVDVTVRPAKKLKLLDKALQKNPAHSLARLHRAQLQLQVATMFADTDPALTKVLLESAVSDYVYIIDHDPGSVVAGLARDELTRLLGAADGDAMPSLSVPQPECPAAAQEAFARAEKAFAVQDKATARDHYEAALTGCPDNSVWWTYAGDAHYPEEPDEALWHYQEALNRYSCNWQALRFSGDAMIHLGRADDAYDLLTHAVSCNPTYGAGWSQAVGVTRSLGGAPRWSGPQTLPRSSDEIDDRPDRARWEAWLQHRETAPVTGLDSAVAAVRAGLALPGDPVATWLLLAEAAQTGHLREAILVLMLEDALLEDLAQAHHDIGPVVSYVRTALLPVR